jgi:hypothetical protein
MNLQQEIKEKSSCLWIDPTMKAGNYVTNSLLASIFIAMGCVEHKISFKALLTAWHRMLELCRQVLKSIKNEDIKTKFYMIAKTVARQGQTYNRETKNFIYDLYINSNIQCTGGTNMLYAIFEALEPDILKNVYFMIVPKHTFLILYNINSKKWSVIDSTHFGYIENYKTKTAKKKLPDIKKVEEFEDITDILYKTRSSGIGKYVRNKLIYVDNKGNSRYGLFIFKSPYVLSLFDLGKFKSRVSIDIWKQFIEIMSHLTFCDEGVFQKYYCIVISKDYIKEQNLPHEMLQKRYDKLYKKMIYILCDETVFPNFFFRDEKTIRSFIGGIYNVFYRWIDVETIEKYVYEYIKEHKINIKPISRLTKF